MRIAKNTAAIPKGTGRASFLLEVAPGGLGMKKANSILLYYLKTC